MKGQETDQTTTIKDAARMLGLSTKSIQRYIAKGFLTKIKEGSRTLLVISELKALLKNPHYGQGRLMGAVALRQGMGQVGDTVTLSRERYEAMLIELGELRTQKQLLLEFKESMPDHEAALHRLEEDLKHLQRRVHALEMNAPAAPTPEERDPQGSPGETPPPKRRPPKPWWQV